MKKILALLILTALLIPQSVHAAALLNPPAGPLAPIMITGTIVNERDGFIDVKDASDDSIIVLNMAAKPYVVDCVTGTPWALGDRKDDKIIAWYGPVTTRSFPPQSNPILILVNIPEDFMPPQYGRVEAIEKENNLVKVTVQSGSLIVTIERDTPISPYLTRNIVTIDDIDIGTDLLMWYPFAAMSFPAQATAQKTVILGQAEITPQIRPAVEILNTIILNGVNMAPLRVSAEAAGFAIAWNGAERSVTLTKGGESIKIIIDSNEYTGGVMEAAAVIYNDLTYVPVSFLHDVIGV